MEIMTGKGATTGSIVGFATFVKIMLETNVMTETVALMKSRRIESLLSVVVIDARERKRFQTIFVVVIVSPPAEAPLLSSLHATTR